MIVTPRNAEDRCVILASDGLWDYCSSQEAVRVVQEASAGSWQSALLDFCIGRAADAHGFTSDELRSLPAGRARRARHDDITIVVVPFNGKQ